MLYYINLFLLDYFPPWRIYCLTHIMPPLPPVHTHESHCGARTVLQGGGRAHDWLQCLRCWMGDSRGQRFTVLHSGVTLFQAALKERVWWVSLRGTSRKPRSSCLHRRLALPFPFPSPPEGHRSSAIRVKQGAHCDINTKRGWVCVVGVSYRDIHCEVESSAWGQWGRRGARNEHKQNKSISITEFPTRLPPEETILQRITLLINTLSFRFRVASHIGKFHTRNKAAPDGLKFKISSTFFFLTQA